MTHKQQQGFTLIEVLIALGILAIALTAIISALQALSQHAKQLEDKTVGHWVAGTILTQRELGLLQTKSVQGQMIMLGHTWNWQMTDKPLEEGIQQVVVTTKNAQGFIVERRRYAYQ